VSRSRSTTRPPSSTDLSSTPEPADAHGAAGHFFKVRPPRSRARAPRRNAFPATENPAPRLAAPVQRLNPTRPRRRALRPDSSRLVTTLANRRDDPCRSDPEPGHDDRARSGSQKRPRLPTLCRGLPLPTLHLRRFEHHFVNLRRRAQRTSIRGSRIEPARASSPFLDHSAAAADLTPPGRRPALGRAPGRVHPTT